MSLVLLQEVAVTSYGPLAAIGAGLAAVGAGIGIGKIGGSAMEACLLYTSPSPRDS